MMSNCIIFDDFKGNLTHNFGNTSTTNAISVGRRSSIIYLLLEVIHSTSNSSEEYLQNYINCLIFFLYIIFLYSLLGVSNDV